eukprot:4056181-Pleurochrysis_carterae.AAC.1
MSNLRLKFTPDKQLNGGLVAGGSLAMQHHHQPQVLLNMYSDESKHGDCLRRNIRVQAGSSGSKLRIKQKPVVAADPAQADCLLRAGARSKAANA